VCSMSDVIMIEDGHCSTGTVLKVKFKSAVCLGREG